MNDVYQAEAEWCYENAIYLLDDYVPGKKYTHWRLVEAADWLNRAENWLDRKED